MLDTNNYPLPPQKKKKIDLKENKIINYTFRIDFNTSNGENKRGFITTIE